MHRHRHNLAKNVLTRKDLSSLAVSSMAPAYSLASTLGLIIALAGKMAALSLMMMAVPMLFIALSYAHLTAHRPSSGADYTWTTFLFGPRRGGFIGVLIVVAYFFSVMGIALPAGTYTLTLIAPALAASPVAVAVTAALWVVGAWALLARGVRQTARVTAILMAVEIIAMLALIGALVSQILNPGHLWAHGPSGWHAPTPRGWTGVFAGSLLALWMVDGWEITNYAAEESKKSRRNPRSGALWGLSVTVILYLVVTLLVTTVVPVSVDVAHPADYLAAVSHSIMGPFAWVVEIAIVVSTGSSLWTTAFILTRALYAMGRDGLLPGHLGKTHARSGSPNAALTWVMLPLLAAVLLMALFPAVNQAIGAVIGAASLALGILFITGALNAARLSRHVGYRHALHHRLFLWSTLAAAAWLAIILLVNLATGPTSGLIFAGIEIVAAAAAGRLLSRRIRTRRPVSGTKEPMLQSHDSRT